MHGGRLERTEITFNPASPSGPTAGHDRLERILLAASRARQRTQCTAVDTDGQELTFNPTSPGTPTPAMIDTGNVVSSVTCASTDQCTAVDW